MTTDRIRRACLVIVRLLPALATVAVLGCSEPGMTSETIRKPMPVAELPETVLKSAQKALPDVVFNDAFRNLHKGVTLMSYEIRGKAPNGKIREVRVSTTGEILEME